MKSNPERWNPSLLSKIGKLAQGIRDVNGNNAIYFILISEVPRNTNVAYDNMVCDHRPLKTEEYRIRLTLGGDILEYAGETSYPATPLLEAKLLLNSVIFNSHLGDFFHSRHQRFLPSNTVGRTRINANPHQIFFR